MNSVIPPRRPIVLKASRDTLVLLAAAGAMTLALAYSVHNRPVAEGPSTTQASAGEWAGQLAELPPTQAAAPAQTEPLSSDALTVPKAAMALPIAPRAALPAKPRTCDSAPCPLPAKTTAAAGTPMALPRRATNPSAPARLREASLVDKLNPLNHLPAAVTRPFASASDTIVGWVKRF